MTASNWPTCIEFTLSFEGGYDTDPRDRGNWTSGVIDQGQLKGTKYGIASHVYPNVNIKELTLTQAKAIYRKDYWPKVAGDEQPAGVDLIVWDICVNSGSGRALAIQKKVLKTEATNATALARVASATPDKISQVKAMCAVRAAFYQGLSTFSVYGKGWLRRNAAAEVLGVKLAATADSINLELGKGAAEAKSSKEKAKGGVIASGGGGAGGTVATAPDVWAFDWMTLAQIGVGVFAVITVIYFIRETIRNKERASAYTEAIKKGKQK